MIAKVIRTDRLLAVQVALPSDPALLRMTDAERGVLDPIGLHLLPEARAHETADGYVRCRALLKLAGVEDPQPAELDLPYVIYRELPDFPISGL